MTVTATNDPTKQGTVFKDSTLFSVNNITLCTKFTYKIVKYDDINVNFKKSLDFFFFML